MKSQLSSPHSSISKKIDQLKKAIHTGCVISPPDVSKFVFLCGANKTDGTVSERRRAILNFAEKKLPHTHFFLAEKIFPLLQKEGHKDNLLDIEHTISNFTDKILIVLESNSSFAELGAFCHQELRNKLIVINDIAFIKSMSFINLGPLKAIEESSGKESVILYKMKEDGVNKIDAIGSTFYNLHKILKEQLPDKPAVLRSDDVNPSKIFNKVSLRFIHDLIYIAGPVTRVEIIEILKCLFGKNDYKKISEHIALLNAFESIYDIGGNVYKSRLSRMYFNYKFDVNAVIASFRNYMLKYKSERIYGT